MAVTANPQSNDRDKEFKLAVEALDTQISSATSQLIQAQSLGNSKQEALIKRQLDHSRLYKEIYTKAQASDCSIEDTRKIVKRVDQRLTEIDIAEEQISRIGDYNTTSKWQGLREFFSPTMRSLKPSGSESSHKAAQTTAKADIAAIVSEHKFLEGLNLGN